MTLCERHMPMTFQMRSSEPSIVVALTIQGASEECSCEYSERNDEPEDDQLNPEEKQWDQDDREENGAHHNQYPRAKLFKAIRHRDPGCFRDSAFGMDLAPAWFRTGRPDPPYGPSSASGRGDRAACVHGCSGEGYRAC